MKSADWMKQPSFVGFFEQRLEVLASDLSWAKGFKKTSTEVKIDFFQGCVDFRAKFQVSFDYSYIFVQSFSSLKEGHPFGTGDEILDKFKAATEKQQELRRKSELKKKQEKPSDPEAVQVQEEPEANFPTMRESTRENSVEPSENMQAAMNSRQLGGHQTPKGKQISLKSMQSKLNMMLANMPKLSARGEEEQKSTERATPQKISLNKIRIKRSDSINFDSEEQVGKVAQKLPLRKNSVRRLKVGFEAPNQLSTNLREKLREYEESKGHKKGQFSVAVNKDMKPLQLKNQKGPPKIPRPKKREAKAQEEIKEEETERDQQSSPKNLGTEPGFSDQLAGGNRQEKRQKGKKAFDIILLKKDGTSVSLKASGKHQSGKTIVSMQKEGESQAPFELMRVKQSEEEGLRAKPSKGKADSKAMKDLMNKYKEITDRLAKVSKEANQLTDKPAGG